MNKKWTSRILTWGAMPWVAVMSMGIDKGCVSHPTQDTIVTSATTKIQGTISEFEDGSGKFKKFHNGQVQLKVNGVALAWVNTVNASWEYPLVNLAVGVNKITGITKRTSDTGAVIYGTIPEFILERKTDLPNQGAIKVFLDFSDSGINDLLISMAENTLDGTLTAAEQTTFTDGVKAKIKNLIIDAYSGINLQFVTADGADVHTIKFFDDNRCDLYGESPGDYKNLTKKQTSKIYLATFKCVVVDQNRLLTQTPAKSTDSLSTRIVDIGTFIGRTAAHEMGHSLGLTSDGANLHGCEGMHNCEEYDDTNPSNRFDDGHFIMDPGPKSLIHSRIGQANATTRKDQKPIFNVYNKSYLDIIHP